MEEQYMKKAMEKAKEALRNREVPVGCVIVHNDEIIGSGCNEVNMTKNATRHAEMIALEEVNDYCSKVNSSVENTLRNSVLYVTTEPCIMCAVALRIVGMNRVVYGCPNPRFGGCGSTADVDTKQFVEPVVENNGPENNECLKKKMKTLNGSSLDATSWDPEHPSEHGTLRVSSVGDEFGVSFGNPLQCTGGVMAEESVDMLKNFYAGENPNAPQPKEKNRTKTDK